jgi:hypothetical protein
MSADAYVKSVRDRLGAWGFREEAPPEGAVLQARRKQLRLSRGGVVETVVVVSATRAGVTTEQFEQFGALSVRAAKEGKVKLPLGAGSSIVVYPVLLADGISQELTEFVESYVPKHWSIIEFPVVVQPSELRLTFATKTPFWGRAYYRKTRREAQNLLGAI